MSDWWWYAGSAGPIEDDVQEFEALAPEQAAIAYGPIALVNAGETIPPVQFLLYQRPNLDTELGVLDRVRLPVVWQTEVAETGSGTMTLGLDEPLLASLTDDALIGVEVDGQVLMSLLPDRDEWVTITTDGPGGRIATLELKGHGAVLDEAVIEPTRMIERDGVRIGAKPDQDDRLFNWAVPQFDDAGWTTGARTLGTGETDPYWDGVTSFPNGSENWFWADCCGTSEGGVFGALPGDVFFRAEVTVPYDGIATIALVADDRAHMYWDGVRIIETGNWTNSNSDIVTVDLEVTAGTHTVAVWAQNNPGAPNNPAAIRVFGAMRQLNGLTADQFLGSSSPWRVLPYPLFAPGMTIGRILRLLVEEAQARGALADLTLHFDDDHDSDGAFWPFTNDIATKVGYSVLTFLRELSDTYIDWRMAPFGLDLWIWNKGGQGIDTGHTFHARTDPTDPLSGNLDRLTHTLQR